LLSSIFLHTHKIWILFYFINPFPHRQGYFKPLSIFFENKSPGRVEKKREFPLLSDLAGPFIFIVFL